MSYTFPSPLEGEGEGGGSCLNSPPSPTLPHKGGGGQPQESVKKPSPQLQRQLLLDKIRQQIHLGILFQHRLRNRQHISDFSPAPGRPAMAKHPPLHIRPHRR